MTFNRQLSRPLLRNLLYLGLFLLPLSLDLINPNRDRIEFSLFGSTFVLVFLLTAWFEHVVILNRFLDRQQYVQTGLGSILALFFFVGVRYLVEQQLTRLLFGSVNYDPTDLTASYYLSDNRYYALASVGLGVLFKLIEDWIVLQQERRALVSEKTTAELAFLKSQINPHFLFNTLNNIYALAYTKSDAAPGAILKLSELMRYMLYESTGGPGGEASPPQKVILSREIEYLRNLVDLETLRVPNAQVQFVVDGNTDLYRIEPMLLISLVENAFKHGDLTDPNHPLVIQLSVRQGQLQTEVTNKKGHHQKDATGGIGLPNVRRRLALLYPNRHQLHIREDAQTFVCRLEISL